jgi:hypothetical protein
MMIEAMGNIDPLLLEVNLVHFPGPEVHTAQHFADRIHNGRGIQIAGRDFVKHWREQKFSRLISVISTEGSRGKFPLQFHGHREPGKTFAYNGYALWCFVSMSRFSRPRSAQRLGSVHTDIRFLPAHAIARPDAISCAV